MESNKQERTNLLGINYLTKHMSTPLSMGGNEMAPKATGPIQGNVFSKALLDNKGNYDAAKKEIESGKPQMNNGAPTLHTGLLTTKSHKKLHEDPSFTHDSTIKKIAKGVGNTVKKTKATIKKVVKDVKDGYTEGSAAPMVSTNKGAFYKHGGPFHKGGVFGGNEGDESSKTKREVEKVKAQAKKDY